MICMLLGQILTFLSYLIFWLSRFLKSKKGMLLCDNISRVFAILGFIFLGTIDGIKNTLFVVVRNCVSSRVVNESRIIKLRYFGIMLGVLFLMYILDFNGISTICVAVCGIFNLYGTVVCNEQGMRLCGLAGSGFYAIFLFTTKNYVGFICELICGIVLTTSFLVYKRKCDIK